MGRQDADDGGFGSSEATAPGGAGHGPRDATGTNPTPVHDEFTRLASQVMPVIPLSRGDGVDAVRLRSSAVTHNAATTTTASDLDAASGGASRATQRARR